MAQNHYKIISPVLLALACGVAILLFSSSAKGATLELTTIPFAQTDYDIIDLKDSSPLDGGCLPEGCMDHCKQRKHTSGRCEKEQCVCRDLKQKGRNLGLLSSNNNNNNNNIVVGR